MANRNLIAGTRAVYGNRFVDAAGSVGSGMRGYNAGISPSTLAGLASMKNTDAQVKAYLNSLNTEMDLLELSDAEQNSIKGYLNTQKNLYSQLATELTQVDAISPRYMELKNRMDSIKQSFVNLKAQTDKFKERKIQYLDDLENGRLSKGNKAEDYNKAGSVYGGGALLIDPNGGINVVTDGGKGLVRYADIKDPFLKDFKTADEILEQNNKLYTAGVKLDASKEALLRNQLKSKLSRDGALESIVEDGLINNERLNVDLDAYATREDAINDVAEILLQGYRDSAAAGTEEKRIKEGKSKPTDTGSGDEGSFYMGYSKNTAEHKKLANSAWEKSSTALQNAVDAINNGANDKANDILKEYEDGINFKFYASDDAYKQRSQHSSYYLKPMIDLNTGDAYIAYKRSSDGEWARISKEDFDKEIAGTADVGPKTNSKPNMG